MTIDTFALIQQYYDPTSFAYRVLIEHSIMVAHKALSIADQYPPDQVDRQFVYEAAMLHDIGIMYTDMPSIGCHGKYPYIAHGYLGRELLDKHGLPAHALVSERHTLVGLTIDDIKTQGLPLPHRDMCPVTLAEKIISYADLFFSKKSDRYLIAKSPVDIQKTLAQYGEANVAIFDEWHALFAGSGASA